jgi:hypothetical protein
MAIVRKEVWVVGVGRGLDEVVVGVGPLEEGVGVGCWMDLRNEVNREDWWWMDMGRGEQWSRSEEWMLVGGPGW